MADIRARTSTTNFTARVGQQNAVKVVSANTTSATASNVIGGIASVSQLNVSGVSTFAGNINATSAVFSGNVTIGGTLTYEDVTNIDAIGIITARNDVRVGENLYVAGISTFVGIATAESTLFTNQLSVSGVSTFQGNLNIGDGDQIIFDNNNLSLYSSSGYPVVYMNGSTEGGFIALDGAGLKIVKDSISGNLLASFFVDAGVDLYYNNIVQFQTTSSGVSIQGTIDSGNLNVIGNSTFGSITYPGSQYGIVYFDPDNLLSSTNSTSNPISESNLILTTNSSGVPSWANVIDGGSY